MPTYSYACTECGHAFDIRQSFTDDALTVCPECGEPRLRKVIHPVGIAFKGSGFYKTDSRASGSQKAAASKGSASGSGEAASTGSDTSTSSSAAATGGSGASSGSGGSASSGSETKASASSSTSP